MNDQTQATPLPKISEPATRALHLIGVTNLEQVSEHTEKQISELHGMGPKGVRMLREALEQHGLSFLM